jgi:hypothetical protein
MRLLITWNATKDTLLFDVINQDLTTWFVEKSQTAGANKYESGDQIIDLFNKKIDADRLIHEEIQYIDTVNEILTKLKLPTFNKPSNWYDQNQLNRLHKDWGHTRQNMPKLTELLYKIDKKYYDAYQEMNCHIHLIESAFQYDFRDNTHWRLDNPFKDTFFDWQVCHLHLKYPGHGRHAFEKFRNMDEQSDIYEDDVNWTNIDSFLGMTLLRPYRLEPPQEFVAWCKKFQMVPHERTIPLANLVDWPNTLANARQVVSKNVKIKNNYFSLELV